ncbi:MAG: potassium-transporting ATPase subunit C [Flavonifractor plautii]
MWTARPWAPRTWARISLTPASCAAAPPPTSTTPIRYEEGNKFYNDGSEYAGVASGSNNYGASNPALAERVQGDIDEFLAEHPDLTVEDIPTDLVTASGSGLDPHISPASAAVQIPQLAENTGLTEEQLEQFVADNTTGKVLGIFGEETVNVLGVNLDIAEALGLIGGVD